METVPTIEQLAEQAMKLSGESRARLADLLVESLDADALGPLDRVWAAEAARRRDEARSGDFRTISADEVVRHIRGVLGE